MPATSIDTSPLPSMNQHMKKHSITAQIPSYCVGKGNKQTSKMVSFRMPMAYIEQLNQQSQLLGKSKSEVLRMGLDVLTGKDAL